MGGRDLGLEIMLGKLGIVAIFQYTRLEFDPLPFSTIKQT